MSTTIAMWVAILTALGTAAVHVVRFVSQSITLERVLLLLLVWSLFYTIRCIIIVARDSALTPRKNVAALMFCGGMLIFLPVSLFGGLTLAFLSSKSTSLKSVLVMPDERWETHAVAIIGGAGMLLNAVAACAFIIRVSVAVASWSTRTSDMPSKTNEHLDAAKSVDGARLLPPSS
jgi:hypothetical protein